MLHGVMDARMREVRRDPEEERLTQSGGPGGQPEEGAPSRVLKADLATRTAGKNDQSGGNGEGGRYKGLEKRDKGFGEHEVKGSGSVDGLWRGPG